jgi:hypothetical protein
VVPSSISTKLFMPDASHTVTFAEKTRRLAGAVYTVAEKTGRLAEDV